ncbi:glycosyltransferase family 2 protein [Haloarcula onubensis]|uniref:Glycosyltransferase family 2 protein n=1 Tax=Haloarcula onubensis TaxID=2950539 RepID=A0ABU2FMX6_9EURY|nr:glycosyltransferase family 2 protein [Halomicroarcula sp. S3CR25-11]MDS0281602.1 glycosyltransferase family 2 protein [Halomicroarcula sp. S3CR25-11]
MSTTASTPTERRLSSDVLIGIPAYNEADTVGDVVRAACDPGADVLVVDDGSDDRTAAVAADAGATVLQHDQNRGYGAALGTLFSAAHDHGADHLVVVDADGQHDPADALDLVATQRATGGDIVIGSRFVEGSETDMPLYRRAGLGVINGLTGAALTLGYSAERVADSQSGFRAYNADAIELLACDADLSDGMDASLDILFHAADEDYSFTEVPADVTYDVAEANTHNPVVHGTVLVSNIFGRVLSDRPGRVLGVPGSICLLLGGLLTRVSIAGVTLLSAFVPILVTALLLTGSGLLGAALAIGRMTPSDR